ncbi:uncharacterized protein LOC136035124 [Artemia franciscana]|uniref:uncharacterized protein LOC136035124 n=1 Tax=Artemia franciscana TaxID=6661 RepID=UPI0032DA610D
MRDKLNIRPKKGRFQTKERQSGADTHDPAHPETLRQGNNTPRFTVESGVKQGCPISPTLFDYTIDWIINSSTGELSIFTWMAFLNHRQAWILWTMLPCWKPQLTASKRIGLTVNSSETKVMVVSNSVPCQSTVDDKPIEDVKKLKYLGSILAVDG